MRIHFRQCCLIKAMGALLYSALSEQVLLIHRSNDASVPVNSHSPYFDGPAAASITSRHCWSPLIMVSLALTSSPTGFARPSLRLCCPLTDCLLHIPHSRVCSSLSFSVVARCRIFSTLGSCRLFWVSCAIIINLRDHDVCYARLGQVYWFWEYVNYWMRMSMQDLRCCFLVLHQGLSSNKAIQK